MAASAAKGQPLFIGSGASWDNVEQLVPYVNGVIVASSLKRNGQIEQPIDPIRVSRFVEAWQRAHHKIQELNRANGNCRGRSMNPCQPWLCTAKNEIRRSLLLTAERSVQDH